MKMAKAASSPPSMERNPRRDGDGAAVSPKCFATSCQTGWTGNHVPERTRSAPAPKIQHADDAEGTSAAAGPARNGPG